MGENTHVGGSGLEVCRVCAVAGFGLIGLGVIPVRAPAGAFLLRALAEQSAQLVIDLIALFDELPCTGEFVVEHGSYLFGSLRRTER